MSRGDSFGRKRVAALAAATIAVLASLFAAAAAVAAPGDVDRSFGERGYVRVLADLPADRTGTFISGEDMVVGPHDEIYALVSVLTCQPDPPCQSRLAVERFLPNGAVDTSFGVNGVSAAIPISQPPADRAPSSFALTADGRPVIAFPSSGNIALVRFDAAGRLDPTFGAGGTVIADFGGIEDEPQLIARPGGALILAATSESVTGRGVVVARYSADGSPDPSFGGGIFKRAFSVSRWGRSAIGPDTTLSELIVLPRGRLMLVGVSGKAAFAAKLRASGRLDRRFGRAGVVRMGSIPLRSGPRAAVDGRGRLVVAGSKPLEEPFSNDVYILRRLADGRRDFSFGGGRAISVEGYLSGPLAVGMQSRQRPVLFVEAGACVRTCYSGTPLLIRFVGRPGRDRPPK